MVRVRVVCVRVYLRIAVVPRDMDDSTDDVSAGSIMARIGVKLHELGFEWHRSTCMVSVK